MNKDIIWSAFAILVALVMFIVVAYAAEPGPNSTVPSPSGAGPAGSSSAPNRPGVGMPPRLEMRELPRVLMAAAINPVAKSDPQVQEILDKGIADLQVVQQDEAAALAAFQQLVQAERANDQEGSKKAHDDYNSAAQKLTSDLKQAHQDMQPLQKRIQELIAHGGAATEAGRPQPQGNAGAPRTPLFAAPSEK